MSAQWKRVPTDTLCGFCTDRMIPKGDPALFRRVPGVKRELVRCQQCAGSAPPDLPPLRELKQNAQDIGDFAALQSAIPKRTRGSLRTFVEDTWTPYKDSE